MGLGTLDLIMTVEKEFGIKIPDAEVDRLMTVGALIHYVAERCPDSSREAIASRIRNLAWENSRRRSVARTPDQITEDMSFVSDLDY